MLAVFAPGTIETVVVFIGMCGIAAVIIGMRSGPTPSQEELPELCPLCGSTKRILKAKMLYGHPVCKKCYYAFADRRQWAWAIDGVVLALMIGLVVKVNGPLTEGEAGTLGAVLSLVFLMKDGIAGHSPGKAILGLKVINEESGRPIGVFGSLERNLPTLIPLMPFVIAAQLPRGHRIGDAWAHSKVIWKKYASHPLFLSKSSSDSGVELEGIRGSYKDPLHRFFMLEPPPGFEIVERHDKTTVTAQSGTPRAEHELPRSWVQFKREKSVIAVISCKTYVENIETDFALVLKALKAKSRKVYLTRYVTVDGAKGGELVAVVGHMHCHLVKYKKHGLDHAISLVCPEQQRQEGERLFVEFVKSYRSLKPE